MPRQNQVIAIEKGAKAKAEQVLTEAYHRLQKQDLITGISRTYSPKDAEGDKLPPEKKTPQVSVHKELEAVLVALTDLFDITATKEYTNCTAQADVVVGGKTLMTKVPVTYLLFLEKQLVNITTFVRKLPVLDLSEEWHFDEARGWSVTQPAEQIKTKKVMKNHVAHPGDEHHPAQVQVFTEDVIIGYWKATKMSGALQQMEVNAMLARCEALQRAVKEAREAANSCDAPRQKPGKAVLSYVFGLGADSD